MANRQTLKDARFRVLSYLDMDLEKGRPSPRRRVADPGERR
ncbi:hypothetical protein [Methylobacterium sp. WL69]|nr:hypothetical protein [Methylobacterium sp. WL69]